MLKYINLIVFTFLILFPKVQINSQVLSDVINEILPDPEGSDSGKEWIELKNLSDSTINLKGYKLENVNLDSGSIRSILIPNDFIIPPNSLGAITELSIPGLSIPSITLGSGKLNLYNSKAKLVLLSPSSQVLNEFTYLEIRSGKSIESPGFPNCIKNVVNELGNTLGLENQNILQICSSPLTGSFEYSTDSETWSKDYSKYSKQLFLKYVPNENIDVSIKSITDISSQDQSAPSLPLTLPLTSLTPRTYDLTIVLTTSFTNIEYVFQESISIGYNIPKMLFSIDNINWSDTLDLNVSAGTKLYFKEENNIPTTLTFNNEQLQSPLLILEDLTPPLHFIVGNENIQSESLNLKVIPELIISEIYPAPNSEEKEYLSIRNISEFRIKKEVYLTDNIDSPTQKKILIELDANEELKLFDIPSLNNSGDQVYLFADNNLIDHIFYNGSESGDILLRSESYSFPVEMMKPKATIPLFIVSNIKKERKGTTARIQGTVSYLSDTFAYIQDSTGGIRVTGDIKGFIQSSTYEITGELSESLGEKKLVNVVVVDEMPKAIVVPTILDTSKLDSQLGSLVEAEVEILANYARSFKIYDKLSVSLSDYEGFDKAKGDMVSFKGILIKSSSDSYQILPIELRKEDDEVLGSTISYPIAIIDPAQELETTVAKIQSNGINSLFVAICLFVSFILFKFLRNKFNILVLKFRLWREFRKMPQSPSSERNTKSDIVSVSS